MSADLGFIAILSFIYLFSSATLGARWTGLNQNRPHARKWVRFENVCPKSGVYPPATNRGPQNHLFRQLRDLTVTLTDYIFGTIYIIGQVRWQPQGVSYIVPKCHELWSTIGFKLDRHFYPLYVNSAFYFVARLRRRRSANGTQPNFAHRWTVSRANNLP